MQSHSAKLPPDWTKVPKVSTRSELLEVRKIEQKPDISFDLDGDGVVGGRDYLIGKRFDVEQNGKLSPEQLKHARNMMDQVDGTLTWGCDSSGNNKLFRIVQKRGNVILDEDFRDVGKSYPAFPLQARQNKESSAKSKTELEARRKEEVKVSGRYFEEKMKKDYWKRVTDDKSPQQRTEKSSIQYREHPPFKTRAEMIEVKKKQLVRFKQLEDLTASCNFAHKSPYERLLLREKLPSSSLERAKTPLHEKIRMQNMQHFSDTYSKRPVGLHGAELPKFSENLQEYWKNNETKSSNSSCHKLTIVKQEQNESTRKGFLVKKVEKFEKPNEIGFWDNQVSKEHCRNSRWTGYHYNFIKKSEEVEERTLTKSTTPEIRKKSRNIKTPKSFITERMNKKNSVSPSKSVFRSTGFTYSQ
jgi:hypothetical protein